MTKLTIPEQQKINTMIENIKFLPKVKSLIFMATLMMDGQKTPAQEKIADYFATQIVALMNGHTILSWSLSQLAEAPCPKEDKKIGEFFNTLILKQNKHANDYKKILTQCSEKIQTYSLISTFYESTFTQKVARTLPKLGAGKINIDKIRDNHSSTRSKVKRQDPFAHLRVQYNMPDTMMEDRSYAVQLFGNFVFAFTALNIIILLYFIAYNEEIDMGKALTTSFIPALVASPILLIQNAILPARQTLDAILSELDHCLILEKTINPEPVIEQIIQQKSKKRPPKIKPANNVESYDLTITLRKPDEKVSLQDTADEKREEELPKKLKTKTRPNYPTLFQQPAAVNQPNQSANLRPGFFDESFAKLDENCIVQITGGALGESSNLYGIWDSDEINKNCKTHEDANNIENLFNTFSKGRSVAPKGQYGIKEMAVNQTTIRKIKHSGKSRVVETRKIEKDGKTAVVFGLYSRKGLHNIKSSSERAIINTVTKRA